MSDPTEIDRRFTFRAPTDETRPKHEAVNSLMLVVAHELDRLLPDGREKALAITALEEVRMRANQAIATQRPREWEDVERDWLTAKDLWSRVLAEQT